MKAVLAMALAVTFLQVDSWILQTRWLALIGALLLILSLFLIFKEEK